MAIIVDSTTAPGASVDLCAVYLNDAADPADFQAFEYAGEALSVNTAARVEARQLVGRVRMVRRSGVTSESFGVTFEQCDREQVAWLRAHVGRLVCVRDHVGTKFFGFYAEVPREVSTAYRDRINVTVSLSQVTHSEAV